MKMKRLSEAKFKKCKFISCLEIKTLGEKMESQEKQKAGKIQFAFGTSPL